ncbi:ABC transporter permease [Algoriphagus halophilus]|uniref:ABC transporter permease n=1 Tax=Algoriphagus halophilus TaxID=226505 RepID=UPI00358E3AC9
MIKNYFKIAIRNLSKNKLHTGINLIGLSLGLGVSILIFFFVQFEMNFDTFHSNAENTFRIKRFEMFEGELRSSFSTPIVSAPALQEEFPQIQNVTRMISGVAQAFLDETNTQSQEFLMVSPDFLKIFDFNLLQGDPSNVLGDKYGIVITEETAGRYFGETNPIGKSIRIRLGESYEEYQVAGILEDIPDNSSIKFDMLLNDENLDFMVEERSRNSWYNVFGETYVTLSSAKQEQDVEAGMEGMMKKY